MLARLALRPDVRLVAGALGMAAAMVLPAALALASASLAPAASDGQWLAYAPDGHGLDGAPLHRAPQPRLAVAGEESSDGGTLVACTIGRCGVGRGQLMAMPEADASAAARVARARNLTLVAPPPGYVRPALVRPDAFLVNASDLPGAPTFAALYDHKPPAMQGATVVPADGRRAFEVANARDLHALTWVLALASVPAAAAVAGVFTRQEMRTRLFDAAVLAALGAGGRARLLLLVRVALAVGLALVCAAAALVGLVNWGGAAFHPSPLPVLPVAAALLAPAGAALLFALLAAAPYAKRVDGVLRGGAADPDPRRHLAWPLGARPLVLGAGLLPVLVVAAALFCVDVGVPLATAQVPAAVVGGAGEWVVGGSDGTVGNSAAVPANLANLTRVNPEVAQAVAETVAPTLLGGVPVVVRGGAWEALAAYHALHLVQGTLPTDSGVAGVVVGSRLAARHDWTLGTALVAQAAGSPLVVKVRVVGVAEAPGPLADEAYVATNPGRWLASIPPGMASLLRFRPETDAVLRVVEGRSPDLQVTQLRVEPERPAAGTVAHAVVEVTNFGAAAGHRDLTLRVGGAAAGAAGVDVAPYARASVRLAFVAPSGPLHLQVNPTLDGSTTDAPGSLEIAGAATVGADADVVVRHSDGTPWAGLAVGLYANLSAVDAGAGPLASAQTGADGHAGLRMVRGGSLAIATVGSPRLARSLLVGTSETAQLLVTAAWTEPAIPKAGDPAVAFVAVGNLGGAPGNLTIHVTSPDGYLAEAPVTVAGNAQTTLEIPFSLVRDAAWVRIENTTIAFGTAAVAAHSAPGVVAQPGAAQEARLADRVLGNARAAMLGTAAVCIATTLALVYLGTQRALRSRLHVARTLRALGWTAEQVRARAALEAALLAGAAMLLALLPAKLLFAFLGTSIGPVVFGHAVPDPLDALFALQSVAAFATVCGLAAYTVAGREAAA